MSARAVVHQLVWELHQDAGLRQRFSAAPAQVYADYGLTAAERAALDEGSPPALAGIGMHPLVQITYLVIKSPDFRGLADASDYLPDLG
jgi:2'-aminobiphenyl-2,3-diol 1,2-dioxygenase small subunit